MIQIMLRCMSRYIHYFKPLYFFFFQHSAWPSLKHCRTVDSYDSFAILNNNNNNDNNNKRNEKNNNKMGFRKLNWIVGIVTKKEMKTLIGMYFVHSV